MDEFPSPDEHLARLMARAQQGDSVAYVTLLRAITPRVRQLVRARRGFFGDSDVEDVVQEVLLSVHTVRATYDPARPLMPWLSAIVRHRLADAGRRHVRQGAHEIGVDDLDVTFQAPAANNREETVRRSGGLGTGHPSVAARTAPGRGVAQIARTLAQRGLGPDRLEHRGAETRHASGHRLAAARASRDGRRMKTDDLIDQLGREATVTKPLPAPGVRTAAWIVWALSYLVLATILMFAVMSSASLTASPLYLVQQGAALVTGIMAARAALASVIPGSKPRVWVRPAIAAAVWVVLLVVDRRA